MKFTVVSFIICSTIVMFFLLGTDSIRFREDAKSKHSRASERKIMSV